MIKLSLKKYLFVLFFSGLLLTNPALAESDGTSEQGETCYFIAIYTASFHPPVFSHDDSGRSKDCVFQRDETGEITGVKNVSAYSESERKVIDKVYGFSISNDLEQLIRNNGPLYAKQLIETLSDPNNFDQPMKLGTIKITGMVGRISQESNKVLFPRRIPYDVLVYNSNRDSMKQLVVALTSEIYEEEEGSWITQFLNWLGL